MTIRTAFYAFAPLFIPHVRCSVQSRTLAQADALSLAPVPKVLPVPMRTALKTNPSDYEVAYPHGTRERHRLERCFL